MAKRALDAKVMEVSIYEPGTQFRPLANTNNYALWIKKLGFC